MNNIDYKNQEPYPTEEFAESSLDLQSMFYSLLRNWYWIALCIGLAIWASNLYLRYSVPIYQAQGKILIKEDVSSSGGISEEAVLEELGLYKGGMELKNEIEILKSRSLMMEVVEELSLTEQYIGVGRIKETEFYQNPPILVDSIKWKHATRRATNINIRIIDNNSYAFIKENEEEEIIYFNQPLIIREDTFWISKNHISPIQIERLRIQLRTQEQMARNYLNRIRIIPIADYSSVLSISLEDPARQKAVDIINILVKAYNQAAIEDKNQVAKKTMEFIDERLILLTRELTSVEGAVETYKERNQIPTEAEASVNFILQEISAYDRELTQQQIRLELLRTVEEMFSSNIEQYELIPPNIVLGDAGSLDTCGSAPNWGSSLFKASAIVEIPDGFDLDPLREALEEIANDLVVDIDLQ